MYPSSLSKLVSREVCISFFRPLIALFSVTGSHEAYLRAILAPVCAPVENGGLGYRAVVVTFRGCRSIVASLVNLCSCLCVYAGAGVPVTSPRLYTAGHTDDLRQALIYISHKYPHAPLLGLAFSLGANIMTRYLGEEGDRSRLSSALVVSCVSTLIHRWLLVDSAFPYIALGHGEKWLWVTKSLRSFVT